jgi:hypothetical protein
MGINGKSKNKSLLRFTTAGSVDDGKSTLIGRLLYDSKSIFEDQMDHIVQSGKRLGRRLPENLLSPTHRDISSTPVIWSPVQVLLIWL